jgi:XTP/dITP diphosphohydrolase
VPEVFEGRCTGRILDAPQGKGGFGYDPLFFSDELGRTFAEATPEQKDTVSHRGRALRALANALGRSPC